ncbi:MAG: barstar family protein [Firmicutes bacterium]|nr:barstar family protein [Bacillota bacterium]
MTNYTVNFRNVKTVYALHQELKDSLHLPEYYGMNMDALWDCISSADIEIPATIYIEGIDSLPKDLKRSKNVLIELLNEAVEWYKNIDMELNVIYVD